MEEDDVREVELSTLAAIYPELEVDKNNPYSVSIEVPVSLSRPLSVSFPAPADSGPQIALEQPAAAERQAEESHELLNLPSLKVEVTLPDEYPGNKPPVVHISTSPPWLPEDVLQKLEVNAEKLWEEVGRDQVVFTYIDDIHQSADDVFGLVGDKDTLKVAPDHKIAILDYDIQAKRKAFEKETFDCGICLDPKKGLVCHRMLDCGHVFCVSCLQDFYNNAITEGDVASIKCLEPSCAEKRQKSLGGTRRKAKTYISPSELLQIPLEHDMVKRYVALKHKNELESDKNTVYCPRPWCQGAARSKKHKKPEGLEFAEEPDDESDVEDQDQPADTDKTQSFSREELLAICEDCYFAFCIRCGQSWHGEFKYCMPKERKDEITEEEQKSLDYLKLHTTPCPTCAAPCQKTHGCNHMRCFRCQTHFCYLCSAWLDPSNPYRHFNVQPNGQVNSCFMRLWELEGGDGGDVGVNFEGGAAGLEGDRIAPRAVGEHHQQPPQRDQALERAADRDGAVAGAEGVAPRGAAPQQEAVPPGAPGEQPERRVAVAREGPLVLRIEGNAPRPPAQARAPAQGGRGVDNRQQRPAGGARGRQAPNGAARRGRGNNVPGPGRGGGDNGNRNRGRGQNQHRIGDANEGPAEDGQLNNADAAWVRNFVHLALNDQEDMIEWDSEDED